MESGGGQHRTKPWRKPFLKTEKESLPELLPRRVLFHIGHQSIPGNERDGIVTGTGLLAILVVTFLFLPCLLVLRERRLDKKWAKASSQESRSKEI